jgi:hypothetical protein
VEPSPGLVPKPPGTQTRLARISAGVIIVNLQTPFPPDLLFCDLDKYLFDHYSMQL